MASGFRALRKIQFGQEVTAGTPVAATAFIVGKIGMKLEQEIHSPDDFETGRLASYEQSEVIARQAMLPFEGDVTYEQIAYFLDMAITQGVVTGTTAPFTWTYSPNYTGSNAPRSFTAEYGDNIQAYESEFVSCRQLEISGQVGDVVKVNADLFGRQVVSTAFTTGLTPPARETVKMAGAQLFVDSSWAGVGATEVPATLVDFNWRLQTGFNPMKFADNQLFFTELTEAKRHIELEMTVGFNTTTAGWFANFTGQTLRMVELSFTGSNSRSLKLQQSVKLIEYMELTEREGQDIVKLKFVSEYDDTGARDLRAILVNRDADLT